MEHEHGVVTSHRRIRALVLFVLVGILFVILASAEDDKGGQPADLSLTLTDSPDSVGPSETLTYTLSLFNAGPGTAPFATVTMSTPAGTTFSSATPPDGWIATTPSVGGTGEVTFTIASLFNQEAAEFQIQVLVNAMATGSIEASASCASGEIDMNLDNNVASQQTTIDPTADLAVSMISTPDSVEPGDNVSYDITITNAGPRTALDVVGVMLTPPNTTFVSLSGGAGWTLNTPAVGTVGVISFAKSEMSSQDSVQIQAVVVTRDEAIDSIDATVSCTSSTPESTPGNETAHTTTQIVGPCTLTVKKPNGGQSWRIGSRQEIKWDSNAVCCPNVRIQLSQNGQLVGKIVKSTENDGTFLWKINPDKFSPGSGYTVRVKCLRSSDAADESDTAFLLTP